MRRKREVLKNVTLENYAAEGKSLARVDGKVIFVENTIPGDEVDVLAAEKQKRLGTKVLQFNYHKYSPQRVTPFCQHFGVCGGCQWQMLPYEKQLEYKQQQVADNLKRIGKVDAARNKAHYWCRGNHGITAIKWNTRLQQNGFCCLKN